MAAQNNAIGTNYVNPEKDKSHQNSKCRLYDDREESLIHIYLTPPLGQDMTQGQFLSGF